MFSLLRDMFRHQAWADAEHWRAIEATPAARDDDAVRHRLHHIHLVQQHFMWIVANPGAPSPTSNETVFLTFDALRTHARRAQSETADHFARLTDADLSGIVSIPGFNEPPLIISRAEALTQAIMHSQWHRGQNSTRLRELGVTPPTLDFIVWHWMGKPAPTWSDS